MDSYFMEKERYLDSMAKSKAMCLDKLRHHDCCAWECKSCEKQRLWNECAEGMDSYSRLMLADKVDTAARNIMAAHPTLEEVKENSEMNRRARREALKEWWKESWYESMFDGSLMVLITVILTPIIVPIILNMECFL